MSETMKKSQAAIVKIDLKDCEVLKVSVNVKNTTKEKEPLAFYKKKGWKLTERKPDKVLNQKGEVVRLVYEIYRGKLPCSVEEAPFGIDKALVQRCTGEKITSQTWKEATKRQKRYTPLVRR